MLYLVLNTHLQPTTLKYEDIGTRLQVLFLISTSYSACIAAFQFGSDNALEGANGSRLLCSAKKSLGLKMPALALVIIW